MRISLFNAAGRTVFRTTVKETDGKFNLPISGFAQGIYHVKITRGKDFSYNGSVAITR